MSWTASRPVSFPPCPQVECEVGAPQVNYRESISRPNDVRYVHKKQSGGSGQFADVAIKFEPGEPGTGFVFRSEIKGGAGELRACFFESLTLFACSSTRVSVAQ